MMPLDPKDEPMRAVRAVRACICIGVRVRVACAMGEHAHAQQVRQKLVTRDLYLVSLYSMWKSEM